MKGHLEIFTSPNPPINALLRLLQGLNENEEIHRTIREELKDIGFGIRMRPWVTPSHEHVVCSSILWMTWGKLVRTIDAPKSRWQNFRSLFGLPHKRVLRSIVRVSIADKRPDGFGLIHWYQGVSIRLDELETVPRVVQTKLAIALASARIVMVRRPETVEYSDSLFRAPKSEIIPSPQDGLPQKSEWTNVLMGHAPIQETDIERIAWIV